MVPEILPKGTGFVGQLPQDWLIVPMDKACSKVTDGTHATPETIVEGRPYITAIHVKAGTIDFEKCLFLSEEDHREIYKRCDPKRGDLAVVNIGAGVGECGYVDVDFEFSMKNVALLKPDPDHLDPYFLFQIHRFRQDRIAHSIKSGGAQPFLSLKDLRKLPILLPPLPEQRKIADILSTWDQAIETTEALLANAQTQKRALMQQLLTGKRRFPAFEGQPWKEVRLGDMGQFRKGKGLPKTVVGPDGNYPCVLYGELYTTYGEFIGQTKSRTDVDDGVISVAGDILIPASTTTSGIDLAIASYVESGGVRLGGDINIFRPKQNVIEGAFLAYFLTHARRHQMARFAQGITIVHLKGSDLLDLSIQVPPLAEQKMIMSLVTEVEGEIVAISSDLTKLRTEKKALMQQLLTGKRRVVV